MRQNGHSFLTFPKFKMAMLILPSEAKALLKLFIIRRIRLVELSINKVRMILLQSESPNGKCAKLHTVEASNNRCHVNRSLYYCLCAPHIWVLFFVHIPFMVNHTINATSTVGLQQHPLLFTMNRTDLTFILWRLHLPQPSHHGHRIIFLQSEGPCGKCAKFHTVAASNNRDHQTRSLYYCLLAPHIWVHGWFFSHILFVVNRTCDATSTERWQHTLGLVHGLCHMT